MKAASLFVVLVLAKAAAMAGHALPFSRWSPIAYLWQDAAVALAFAILEPILSSRPRVVWMLYGALTMYVAINVPVVRVLSTVAEKVPQAGSLILMIVTVPAAALAT